MINCKTNTKIALAFVGTLIGAGFASGKEIALFFGTKSILSPILSGILSGFFAFVFLELGRISKDDVLFILFTRYKAYAKYAVSLINLVIFCAMLAAAEISVKSLFGISGGGLVSGLLSLAVIMTDSKRLRILNAISVPLVLLLIITLFGLNPSLDISGEFTLMSPILYSSFNILTGGFVISKMAKGITRKQSLQIGLLVSIILVTLTCIIYFITKANPNAIMPVIETARMLNLEKVASLIVFICILTTMISTLSIASENNKINAFVMLAICYPLAVFGFDAIVNTAYPIMAIMGIMLCGLGVIRLVHNEFALAKMEKSLKKLAL